MRPRKLRSHAAGKALFKIDVQKLRLAFAWLKEHNPYYYNVEWREDAAVAWEAEDVTIGVAREASDADGQALPVGRECFKRWMQRAQSEASAGDEGYPIGRRLLAMLRSEAEEDDEDLWNLARRMVAEVFGQSAYRMAKSLPLEIFAVALCARDLLDLGLPPKLEPEMRCEP